MGHKLPTFKQVVQVAEFKHPHLFNRRNKPETMKHFKKLYREKRRGHG